MGCVEASGDSFAIVQRPTAEWVAVSRGSRIQLTVNNNPVSTDIEVVSTEVSQLLPKSSASRLLWVGCVTAAPSSPRPHTHMRSLLPLLLL
jgi:hypothetical protein